MDLFRVNLFFVHTISKFELRLVSGSATTSSRKAMRTPPPWVFLSFRMVLQLGVGMNRWSSFRPDLFV